MIISIDNIYISIVTVFQHTETRPHIHISYILAWKCKKSETMCRKLESVKVKVWKCEKGSSVARSETQCSAGALPSSGGHTQHSRSHSRERATAVECEGIFLQAVFLKYYQVYFFTPHTRAALINCCWIFEGEKDTKPFSASSISQIWSTVFPTKSREALLLHWRWTCISKKVSLSQTNKPKQFLGSSV